MKKNGEVNMFEIILFVVIVGLVVSYFFGWISFGNKVSATPTENDLPQTSETQENQTSGETLKFQECKTVSECNWDKSKYYNRNCEGNWRCIESPTQGEYLCSYGCVNNSYAGDGVCGGEVENEWNSIDCNPSVGFIGKLIIS